MKGRASHMLIAHIRRDGGTQIREGLDEDVVTEYAEQYRKGKDGTSSMPDVEVFQDGTTYWLVDGFHRVEGALRAGAKRIMAAIKPGTQSAAILAACAANQKHGLRRSNATKRRQVTVALQHPESGGWSDRAIAKHCGVDHGTVADVRAELAASRGAATEQGQQVEAGQGGEIATLNRVKTSVPPRGDRRPASASGTGQTDGEKGAAEETQDPGPDSVDPNQSPAAPRVPRLEMDTLGLELSEDNIEAWTSLESALGAFDNFMRQAQAVLQPEVGRAGRDGDKLSALRKAAHDLAARARKTVLPKTVCLYCKDPTGAERRRHNCSGCGGIGFLVEEQLGAVPRELLARGDAAVVIDQERGGFAGLERNPEYDAAILVAPGAPVMPHKTRPRRISIQDSEGRELVVERDEGAGEGW